MACAYSTATAPPFMARPTITFTCASTLIYNHKVRLFRIRASRGYSSFPSERVVRRKNYLRQKILKTLTKPGNKSDGVSFPTELTISIPLQPEDDTAVVDSHDEIQPETLSDKETEEFRVSETVGGERKDNLGIISTKSLLKFGVWFVGVYLLQAICTVWVFGNGNKEERFNSLKSDSKGNVFTSGNNAMVTYLDEHEMEERVNEIRAMARQVRENEKMERQEGNGSDGEIEKEIGERLVKLENRLNSKREKFMPDSFTSFLRIFGGQADKDEEDGEGENGSELNDFDNKKLMFKKKFRFKSRSLNSSSSPKGFTGSRDKGSSSNSNGSVSNGESRESDFGTLKLDSGRKGMGVRLNSSQINGNKIEKEKMNLHEELGSGAVQKVSEGKSSGELRGMSESQDVKKMRNLLKEKEKTATKIDGPASSSHRDPGKRPVPYIVGGKQSAEPRKFWWLNLPFVLVILMRRGSELEQHGLYTVKTLSQSDGHVESYTVAFEDHGDANNFCHLLDCFFEGLGDFIADIVPLSVEELYEGARSGSKKVIVVKKRQLKLYVGQPIAEVEMALLSLIEQDKGT